MDDGAALFRRRRRWHPSLHAARTDHSADRDLADATRETVMRYHLSWKHRDIDAVMALYHPEVEYNDFFQNRRMRLADLREYVEATMPGPRRVAGAHRPYPLRRRYRLHPVPPAGDPQRPPGFVPRQRGDHRARRPDLAHQRIRLAGPRKRRRSPGRRRRPAAGQPPGLSLLARDLEHYFQQAQPYLDPDLDLTPPQPDFLPAQPGARPELLPVRQPDPPATPARPAFRRAARTGRRTGLRRRLHRCRPSTAASASTPASLRANT